LEPHPSITSNWNDKAGAPMKKPRRESGSRIVVLILEIIREAIRLDW
jgi:hypothetical protein